MARHMSSGTRRAPGPTTRAWGLKASGKAKESDQAKRRARRQSQNCKTEFFADTAAALVAISLIRNPPGAEISGYGYKHREQPEDLPPLGGRGGIRTHGTLAGTPVFKTGALNH